MFNCLNGLNTSSDKSLRIRSVTIRLTNLATNNCSFLELKNVCNRNLSQKIFISGLTYYLGLTHEKKKRWKEIIYTFLIYIKIS